MPKIPYNIPKERKKKETAMISDEINSNPICLVIHQKTGRPFIDASRNAYIFLKEEDAKKFCQLHHLVEMEGPRYFKYEEICSTCYSAGAKCIIARGFSKGNEKIELTKIEKRKDYNTELNKNLNLLHETKKKEYLLDIVNNIFIVPVKINNENKSEIIIEYSIAEIKGINYFIAFSDVDEYTLWASKVDGFKPLEITYRELRSLCHEDDCIINIYGSRYILTQEKMAKIDGDDTLLKQIQEKRKKREQERLEEQKKKEEQKNSADSQNTSKEETPPEQSVPKIEEVEETIKDEKKTELVTTEDKVIQPDPQPDTNQKSIAVELEEIEENTYAFEDDLPFSNENKPQKKKKEKKNETKSPELPFLKGTETTLDTPSDNNGGDNPFGEDTGASEEYIPPDYNDDVDDDDYMIFGNDDDDY